MSELLPIVLLAALFVLLVTHLAIAVLLAVRRAWVRVLAALVLPPLGPWWAWRSGKRVLAWTWVASVAAFAAAVALA